MLKIVLLSRRERAGDLGRGRADRPPQVAGGVGARRRDAGDRRRLPDRQAAGRCRSSSCFPARSSCWRSTSSRSSTRSTSPSRTTRRDTSCRASEAIANIRQNSLTEAANGASYSMTLLRDDDHKLVLGAARPGLGQDLHRHAGRAEADPARPGDADIDGTITRGHGLHDRSRATSSRRSTRSSPPTRCRSGAARRSSRRASTPRVVLEPTYRYDSEANTVRPDQGRRRLQGRRPRLLRRRERRGDRAGLEDVRRPAQLQPHRPQLADPRPVPEGPRLDDVLRRSPSCSSPSRSACCSRSR